MRLLPWAVPSWLFDVGLVSIAVIGFLRRPFSTDGSFEVADMIALVLGVAFLLARRRFPLASLAASAIASVVVVASMDRPSMLLPVTLAILFTVGLERERRVAMIAGAVTTVLFGALVIALLQQGTIDGAGLASIAWPAFAVAAGIGIRASRENMASAQERARRAERSRELEAERRVVEERLRIARDVHDLVAHHIAVINVQAGVASHLMTSDPGAATEAVDTVRGAASTVIDQLGELLSVLRSADDADEPIAPTPNLESIDDLISSFSASGLVVRRETTGAPRPLSESGELAAYRVVQEALTNAHKYGDGSVDVALRFDDAGLEVGVRNAVADGHRLGFGIRPRRHARTSRGRRRRPHDQRQSRVVRHPRSHSWEIR